MIDQDSVLNLLFVIIVLEVLSCEFRMGIPWELLYVDDLVIIADSFEKCVVKVNAWKEVLESKNLRVNMKKTMFTASGHKSNVLQDCGQFLCAIGVGNACHYVLCMQILGTLSGDIVSANGRCETAVIAKCRTTWVKFFHILPTLTVNSLSPRLKYAFLAHEFVVL